MTTKPSDLIAIANPKLSEKLSKKAEKEAIKADIKQEPEANQAHQNFKKDVWRAVFTLNLLRYGLAIFLLILIALRQVSPDVKLIDTPIHPDLFFFSTIVLLLSAIAFSFLTMTRRVPLSQILLTQFFADVIIAALLVHATGSVTSTFTLIFFVFVTTGSVVLRRKQALALASGAVILMFYEHLHSVLRLHTDIKPSFGILGGYGVLLMFSSVMVSALAQRLRVAELRTFIPGSESIEDYLVREEVSALKSALASTNGNKTEAAKLLGMTFRSFRYKLNKYEIESGKD